MTARRRLAIPIVACAIACAGCFTQEEWRRFWDSGDRGAQPEPSPRLISKSRATRDTIGELVTVDGLRLLQVRGFGLVVDLAGTGGSDGPEAVRKYLTKEVQRWQKPSEPGLSPNELLSGSDTAMVEVTGLVPAASQKGDPFDVVVRALGTQTKSLATGRLVLCDLKPWAETLDGILGAKAVAAARGPIFISPLGLDKEIPDKIDLHTGLVLGGGSVKRSRQARLVLNDPSPSVARRIVDRLNGRYATGDPIAVARSHTAVELTIPKTYRGRKRLFFEHVLHTTLNADPASLERRAKALADEVSHPDAEFESVGVAWEAMGRIALPHIKKLYSQTLPAANYCAARAGMRLGDKAGMEAIAKHALDRNSPFRDQAIDELGYAVSMHGAGEYLRDLLSDPDTDIRVRAYRALRRRPHPAIKSMVLYEDNLILDSLDATGPYLIYVERSMTPRVAVFGRQMRCRPPAIYPGDRRDDRFLHTQISALPDDRQLTVIFRNKRLGGARPNQYAGPLRTHHLSPELSASLNVVELIRFLGDAPVENYDPEAPDSSRIEALGVPYDEIVDILYTFCDLGTIPAALVPEDLTGALEAGIDGLRERKETEY